MKIIAAVLAGTAILAGPSPAVAQIAARTGSIHLVVPFHNASGDSRVFWLGEGSAILLAEDVRALGGQAIRREDRVDAFERLHVPPVASLSHATVIRLGQVVGAANVVYGSFEMQGEELVVRARTIRLDTGRLSPEIAERGPLKDLLNIYGRVARRIVPDSAVTPEEQGRLYPSLPAFEQYVKGLLAAAPEARIAFLTQALRVSTTFQRARLALWDVHTEQGEHERALASVREIPAGDRLSRQARFLGGVSMLHLNRPQDALAEFGALNREAPDPALLNNMGIAQLRRGAASSPSASATPEGRAVSYLGEAVALDNSDPDLFFNVGYAYWNDRDPEGAIHWLREAVRRNPADDAAHYVLGVALQAAGNTREAVREKELARQLSSSYAEWEQKRPGTNAAPPALERIKTDIDVPAALRVDAAVGAAEQRDQQAIAAFHLERGRRFSEEGRETEAVAELRRTIFLAPYEVAAHVLLARIHLRNGRQQEAIDAATIAVWSDPSNTEAKELLDSLRP